MKFSLYIAKRYLFTKSKNSAINIISIIASLGVIIASLLLFIVLSGFDGLKTFSVSYSNLIAPDYKVLPSSGKKLILTDAQLEKLDALNDVAMYSKVIEEKVFLNYRDKNELAILKGVDENYTQTVHADSILVHGQWINPKSYQSVCGFALAEKLELGVFDFSNPLKLFVPKPGKGQINDKTFNKVNVQNIGLFEVNEELNEQYVFTSLLASQELLKYDTNEVSYLEIKSRHLNDKQTLKNNIEEIFNQNVIVKSRIELNDALYKMLKTENIFVYLIFTLILIIALFNVVGSIIMMIIDKKNNLKTLFNIGASIKDIKNIFFLQGTLLTLLGGTLGVILGILVVGIQVMFELVTIPGTNIPYPIELNVKNIMLVLATIYILGILASKLASYRINSKVLD